MHANSLFAKITAHQTGGFGPAAGRRAMGAIMPLYWFYHFPARPGIFELQRSSSTGINLQPTTPEGLGKSAIAKKYREIDQVSSPNSHMLGRLRDPTAGLAAEIPSGRMRDYFNPKARSG